MFILNFEKNLRKISNLYINFIYKNIHAPLNVLVRVRNKEMKMLREIRIYNEMIFLHTKLVWHVKLIKKEKMITRRNYFLPEWSADI